MAPNTVNAVGGQMSRATAFLALLSAFARAGGVTRHANYTGPRAPAAPASATSAEQTTADASSANAASAPEEGGAGDTAAGEETADQSDGEQTADESEDEEMTGEVVPAHDTPKDNPPVTQSAQPAEPPPLDAEPSPEVAAKLAELDAAARREAHPVTPEESAQIENAMTSFQQPDVIRRSTCPQTLAYIRPQLVTPPDAL